MCLVLAPDAGVRRGRVHRPRGRASRGNGSSRPGAVARVLNAAMHALPAARPAGLALRRQGLDLDLRKADYFLGSEASNEDVRQAVEALTVSSKPSTIKPVSKGLSSRRVEIDTNVPAYVRRSGLGTYAGKQAVYAKAAAKKAAAKKAAAKKAPARKAAAKKAPARKAAAKKFA